MIYARHTSQHAVLKKYINGSKGSGSDGMKCPFSTLYHVHLCVRINEEFSLESHS